MRIFSLFLLCCVWSFPAVANTKIIFLGDSLTEGYGVDESEAFPALVEKKFHQEQIEDIHIVNSGFSGSTSASAEGRMKWLLQLKPDILFLALGANDGLRGLKIDSIRTNLNKAIRLAKENKVYVILAGMKMPPNYGEEYTKAFEKVFFEVAKENNVDFVPFLLEGVAADPSLNLPDGIHPNPKGHQVIAELIYPYLKKARDTIHP